MNHRMGQRIHVDHTVSLNITEQGWIDGRLVNISLTGAAIRCREWKLLELYTPVVIKLEPSDGMQPEQIKINGFVVRIQDGLLGLMFMKDVVDLVKRLKCDPAKTTTPHAARPQLVIDSA